MHEHRYTRTPYLVVHHEQQARKDVYGSIDDAVVLQAQLLRGESKGPTALIGMHPIGAPGYLGHLNDRCVTIAQVLDRGGHVLDATRTLAGTSALTSAQRASAW